MEEHEIKSREIRDETNALEDLLTSGGDTIRRMSVNSQNSSTSVNETDQEIFSSIGNFGPNLKRKDDGESITK